AWPCLPVATLAEVNPRGVDLHLEGAAEVGGGVARDGHLATALRGKHRLSRGEKKRCRPGREGHNVHGPQATPVVGGAWPIAGDPQLPGHSAGDLIEGVCASVGHGGRCDNCPHHLAVEEHVAVSRRGQRRGRRKREKCSSGDQYCRKPCACSRSHAWFLPSPMTSPPAPAPARPQPATAAAQWTPTPCNSAPRRSCLGCGSPGRGLPGGTHPLASQIRRYPKRFWFRAGPSRARPGLDRRFMAGSSPIRVGSKAPRTVRSGGSPAWLPKQPTDNKTGPVALEAVRAR